MFKKKQKKTNTFNKSQKKSRHQQQQLTLEIAFDLFHSLCRPKKTSHQKHLWQLQNPPAAQLLERFRS